jgi:hypothetical protein
MIRDRRSVIRDQCSAGRTATASVGERMSLLLKQKAGKESRLCAASGYNRNRERFCGGPSQFYEATARPN